jgi:Holliday junction resolvasome RuvABC DNA-binding subunit
MTRITNSEQILLLLRAHLERTRNAERQSKSDSKAIKQARSKPIERMQALSEAGLSESQLERALISGLLTEEFGSDLTNEPKFQQIIDEVTDALRRDARAHELLTEALVHLRG